MGVVVDVTFRVLQSDSNFRNLKRIVDTFILFMIHFAEYDCFLSDSDRDQYIGKCISHWTEKENLSQNIFLT